MKKVVLILCLVMFAHAGFAQVQLSRIGFGLSSWNRGGLDEFATMFQPLNYTSRTTSIIPSMFGVLDLYNGIGVEGRAALYHATFGGESAFASFILTDRIKQRIIPLSFGAVYSYRFSDYISAGLGVGLNTYYIQNEVRRTVIGAPGSTAPTTLSGRTTAPYFKAEVEYMFSEVIGVGLDLRYNTGSYNFISRPEPGANPVTNQIGLEGLEIGLSLRYRIPRALN